MSINRELSAVTDDLARFTNEWEAATASGKEHERGSKSPGLHPDEKSDGE